MKLRMIDDNVSRIRVIELEIAYADNEIVTEHYALETAEHFISRDAEEEVVHNLVNRIRVFADKEIDFINVMIESDCDDDFSGTSNYFCPVCDGRVYITRV